MNDDLVKKLLAAVLDLNATVGNLKQTVGGLTASVEAQNRRIEQQNENFKQQSSDIRQTRNWIVGGLGALIAILLTAPQNGHLTAFQPCGRVDRLRGGATAPGGNHGGKLPQADA